MESSSERKSLWKKYGVSIILGLAVFAMSSLGWFEPAELSLYDTWFNVRGIQDPGDDIAIVAIDEKAIKEIGPMAWPRGIYAGLLEKLASAKVIGFDLVFDLPSSPDQDDALASAIKANGRTVLASMFTFEQDQNGEWMQRLVGPQPSFASGCAGTGFVNMPAEKGNAVRSVTVADTNAFGQPYPAFSLAVAMESEGLNPGDLVLEDDGLHAGDLDIPVDSINQTMVDFWGPGGTFPTYSFIDVLDGKVSADAFKDKIVLVGTNTPTEKDYYETPYTQGNLVLSGALPAPGVEIHASAIKTYFTGRYFHRVPPAANLMLLIILWALVVFTFRRNPWAGLAAAIALAAGTSALVYFLWLSARLWLNLAAPLAMIGVTYTGVTVENLVRTEMERRRTRSMFGRYVSETVVNELMRHPDQISLGGVRQEVTVLFTDIRGFTSYSEGKTPEEVVARLNDYFTAMAAIIFKHGGTLDKYLGDGLMAVFGAPMSYPDHAKRAVAAAVEMMESLDARNRVFLEKGEPDLGMGIGLNSGSVVVGNIGSPERMEYTAIGEEVNLASRLEAMTKEYGARAIISGRTVEKIETADLPSGWQLIDLGNASVRGLEESVRVFSLERTEAGGCETPGR